MTRRQVLQFAALPVAGAGAAPITKVETYPVPYPVRGQFRFFRKPERPSVFVKITCRDGASGWGQSVPIPTWSYETPESVVSTLKSYLAPALVGRDPLDIAGAHAAMNRAIAPSFSTGMPIAKAGVDLALHDLAGRLAKQSVPMLWNLKAKPSLPLSWTVNPQTLEETERLVAEGQAHGYRHFNVKLAPDPKFDLEMCRIVRRLAPEGFFWGDANGGYDLDNALAIAPKLADLGMNVFEQPLPANQLSGYREMKKQGALPILMDEGIVSPVELVEFIQLKLLDGVAMKPARTAGLWQARRQIEIVQDAGLLFLGSGLTDPDVSLAASLQLYAAYQLEYPAALNGPQFLAGSFLREPLKVANGEIAVPDKPGLGVEVDEARVREAAS